MKTPIYIALSFLALAAVCAAEEKPAEQQDFKFDTYTEYRPSLNRIPSDDPGMECPNTRDRTLPMHGPWHTNPGFDSITISYVAAGPSLAGVEYRIRGTTNGFKRVWGTIYGAADYHSHVHSFHLKNLEPATEYEYRFLSALNSYELAKLWCGIFTGKELYSFKTLDPELKNYKVFLTADTHGSSRVWLEPSIERSNARDADLFVQLGDQIEDTMANDAENLIMGSFLDECCRIYASRGKAAIFVRGNHECQGIQAWKYGTYFPRPDGKGYFSFSQGPALFVVLDAPANHGGMPINEVIAGASLAEQAAWLADLKKTEAWRKATFRIVMAHIPMTLGGGDRLAEIFREVLVDKSKDGRIHLYLAGHMHVQMRRDPGTAAVKVNNPFRKSFPRHLTDEWPFAEVIEDMGGGMTLEVSPEKLTLKAYDWRRHEPRIMDAFEVYPDGHVKDLVEVPVYTEPNPK